MRVTGIAVLLLLGACDHSDPFLTGARTGDGAFDAVVPIRLTYSTADDGWPTISPDGAWLSYRYARGTADRDFCAGILPANGGQRLASLCAWEQDDRNRSDDFRSVVLLDDHTVAYTRSTSGTGSASPTAAALYVADLDAPRDARAVLSLLARPAGGGGLYRYLLDPVREDSHTLLALAADAVFGPRVQFGPVDTTYLGIEIVRIDVSTTPATVTPVAPATAAVAWALDRSTGRLYYQVPTYSAPPGSGAFRVVADTIWRVPLAGGNREVAWGRPELALTDTTILAEGMGGFAVAMGRLFATPWDRRQPGTPPGQPVPPPETRSRLVEITAAGEVTLDTRISIAPSLWTRLSASPDGRSLVAGSVVGSTLSGTLMLGGQLDLYRIPLD